MKKLLGLLAGAALGAIGLAAYAQVTVPQVAHVNTLDLFPLAYNGVGTAQTQFATAQQINGVIGYLNEGVLATGQTVAFGNSTQEVIAQSSGTIAALTLTASANPGDGQLNCYFNIAATTALTWNANTGQSIANAPTAGVANTKYCMIWVKSAATWYRAQ